MKVSFGQFVKAAYPFIIAMALLFVLLGLVPQTVLFLPDHLM